jgi:hypothetical protein
LKKILLIILIAMLVSVGVVYSFAADKPTSGKVIAYYFHGNFRCPTCYKLETYSREAIEANFKNELASGKIVFNVINTDEKGNEHFVNDYQLYTKSLVISLIESGKEVKSKNLTKIWDYVGNKQKFFEYVTSEINGFLKGS